MFWNTIVYSLSRHSHPPRLSWIFSYGNGFHFPRIFYSAPCWQENVLKWRCISVCIIHYFLNVSFVWGKNVFQLSLLKLRLWPHSEAGLPISLPPGVGGALFLHPSLFLPGLRSHAPYIALSTSRGTKRVLPQKLACARVTEYSFSDRSFPGCGSLEREQCWGVRPIHALLGVNSHPRVSCSAAMALVTTPMVVFRHHGYWNKLK